MQGRNVVIAQKFGSPKITKDGVTVAKAIEFSNPLENVGAQLVRTVASKTNDQAGDGAFFRTPRAHASLSMSSNRRHDHRLGAHHRHL